MPNTEEIRQDVNLNVSGTEKLAGATMLLQDFSAALQQLVSNPLGGAYTMNRVAHGFQTAFIDPLKKTKDLRDAQRVAFDIMVLSGSRVATLAGFVGGLSLQLTEVIRKTRIASSELGQFMSLNQLPGGAEDLYDAQLIMQEKFITKSLQYNEAYGQEYEQLYKQLRRKILADITPPGASPEDIEKITEGAEPQIEALIEQLTTLQRATGLSVAGFSRMRESFKAVGLDMPKVIDLYKLLTTEYLKGTEFEGFSGVELGETLQTGMRAFSEAGTLAPAALKQILTIMENYAPYAGVEEIQKLLSVVPSFQNDFQKGTTARMLIPGMSAEDIRGPEGGANILNALVKEVHKMIGKGKTPENILEIWAKNAGGIAKLEKLGITAGTIQTLNAMTALDDITTRVVEKMDNMNLNPGILKDTEDMKATIKEVEEGLKGSENIINMFGKAFEFVGVQSQKLLKTIGVDVPVYVMQAGILSVMGGLVGYKTLKLFKWLKNMPNLVPATLPPAPPTGGGFVPWGTELTKPVTTTTGQTAGTLGKLGKVGKVGGKLVKGLGYAGVGLSAITEAFDVTVGEITDMEKRGKSPTENKGELIGRGMIETYARVLSPANIINFGLSIGRVIKGENVAKAFWTDTWNVNNLVKDAIFGGKKPADTGVAGALGPMFMEPPPPQVSPKPEGVSPVGDIGNLRIIISNDAGNELANKTLKEAQEQGFIRVIMSSVSEA